MSHGHIRDSNWSIGDAEKKLAYSAWFMEQCLKYLFMNRLMLLHMIASGRTFFNNGVQKMTLGMLWSDKMTDGFWEACKHMAYGDRIDGKPQHNDDVKLWAALELDAYVKESKEHHSYDQWHETLLRASVAES